MHPFFRWSSFVLLTSATACGAVDSRPGVDAPGGGVVDPFGGDGGPKLLAFDCPPLAMPAAAATVFVDVAAVGAGDGSRNAPFPTVAQAFAAAGPKGVIFVAAGTYRESLVIPDKDLVLHGGFTAAFHQRADGCATILEAPTPAQTVLEAAPAVKRFTLDGVTVRNGARGLRVLTENSGVEYTIANAVFTGNGKVDEEGGAMAFNNANVKVTRTAFRSNRAAKGPAIAFVGDDATVSIDESVFEANTGHSDHGGALYLGPKSGSITRSTFRRNEIGATAGYGWGGAVVIFAGVAPASMDFAYNVFTDNLASVGGAVFIDDGATATMSHDLLYRNRSYAENGVARGGAIYVDGVAPGQGSTLVADHLTVADNNLDATGRPITTAGGGAFLESSSTVTVTNSIFWNNGAEPLFGDRTCSVAIRYSIAGACSAGTCTIGPEVFEPTDVLFVEERVDNFHERASSTAVDRADPAASVGKEPSPNGGRANLGAFGGTSEASTSP